MTRFLLDTGLLLGLTRQADWARDAVQQLRDHPQAVVWTSAICHGEILALAEKNGWGRSRRDDLDRILRQLPVINVNRPAILNAYASIYTWTHGTMTNAAGGQPPPTPAVPMKQNDMWIAATAHAIDATLMSTDKDFDHLHGVWLNVRYVDQAVGAGSRLAAGTSRGRDRT